MKKEIKEIKNWTTEIIGKIIHAYVQPNKGFSHLYFINSVTKV